MCKTELYNYMKQYFKDVMQKGFAKVELPVYHIEDDETLNKRDFSGSEKEWMENHVKFEEKNRGRSHKRSRSVKERG